MSMFCYDKVFGTLVNRMCAQAVLNKDLSVYGNGEQRIGIISLEDAVESYVEVIRKFENMDVNSGFFGVKESSPKGFYKVINQVTATSSVKEIAEIILNTAKKVLKSRSKIVFDKNIRNEKSQKYYVVIASTIFGMGLGRKIFADGVKDLLEDLKKHKNQLDVKMLDFGAVNWV